MSWTGGWDFSRLEVQGGTVVAVIFDPDSSQWLLVRSNDARAWDVSIIDTGVRGELGMFVHQVPVIAPDGSAYVFAEDGTLDVGEPTR